MKNLLVYTTRYGSVEKCVKLLQPQLIGETAVVNLKEQRTPNLEEFDTIILGGSIYAGKTQKALRQFATNHLKQLLKKKVFLFLCSGFQKAEDFQANFPEELCKHAELKSLFGGELSAEKLNVFERVIVKMVSGKGGGDYSRIQEETIAAFAKAVNGE